MAQNGRRFHVLANRRPKSVAVFTIWRAEGPNRSSFSRFGEQKTQIGRRFHVLASRRPKSVVVFTFWRAEGSNRSSISRFGEQNAQIGPRFHVLANRRPKSVVDFVFWQTDRPNQSSIVPKGGKGSAKRSRQEDKSDLDPLGPRSPLLAYAAGNTHTAGSQDQWAKSPCQTPDHQSILPQVQSAPMIAPLPSQNHPHPRMGGITRQIPQCCQ